MKVREKRASLKRAKKAVKWANLRVLRTCGSKNKGRQEGAVIRVDPRFVMKEHLKALEKYEEYKKEH